MGLKSIILCADDFGQNAPISEGIIHLSQQGRLNAVSCMVNGQAFISHIQDLKATKVQLGLHLNLTHGKALISGENHYPLSALLQAVYVSKSLKPNDFCAEINAQIKAFKQITGDYPKFIDGHQHVHQLPIIRDALIQVVDALGFKPWFRTTYSAIKQVKSLKAFVLYCLGGKAFAKKNAQLNYNTCCGFSGEYPLKQGGSYRVRFQKFLSNTPDGGLIMCHPGLVSHDKQDKIANIRVEEYQYLSSLEFQQDLASAGVTLAI